MIVDGAGQPRQRNRAQPDGARALHEHAVAGAKRRALEDVHRGQQAAAAADVVVERDRVRQPRDRRRPARDRSPAPSRRTALRRPSR